MRGFAVSMGMIMVIGMMGLSATSAGARGFLGLFADEEPVVPPQAPQEPQVVKIIQDNTVIRHDFAAFVDDLSRVADPDAEPYRFLEVGDEIDIGARGSLTLTLLEPCFEEVIIGGNVRLQVAGGQVDLVADPRSERQGRAVSCRPLNELLPLPAQPKLRRPTSNPLFDPTVWQEMIINRTEPIFKWPDPVTGALVVVELFDIDQSPPVLVWREETPYSSAAYPADAEQQLKIGHPYMAVVRQGDAPPLFQVFSIDQNLAYANIPLNAVVVLNRPLPEDGVIEAGAVP